MFLFSICKTNDRQTVDNSGQLSFCLIFLRHTLCRFSCPFIPSPLLQGFFFRNIGTLIYFCFAKHQSLWTSNLFFLDPAHVAIIVHLAFMWFDNLFYKFLHEVLRAFDSLFQLCSTVLQAANLTSGSVLLCTNLC